MRYLILSDIHANLEALHAVMEAAEKDRYDRILCCGDIVGYGASPNETAEWTRSNVPETIRGNHDKACAGLTDLEWFNPVAQQSTLWTQSILTLENIAYLTLLEKGPKIVGEFQILHGSPVDEDEYVVQRHEAAMVAPYLETQVSFFGHTHIQGGFEIHPRGVAVIPPPVDASGRKELELDPDLRYMINAGSIGQPRDGDPRAAWIIYVPEDRLVIYRRTPYDITAAQAKVLAAGLPPMLAQRLRYGH